MGESVSLSVFEIIRFVKPQASEGQFVIMIDGVAYEGDIVFVIEGTPDYIKEFNEKVDDSERR